MGVELALFAVAGATALNVGATVKQNKLARREARARQMIEQRRTRQERIASVREQQMAAAQVAVQGEGAGVASSSGVAGAVSGINTTAASNASFVNQVQSLNEIRARLMEKSARIGMVTDIVNTVSGAAVSAASMQQPAPKTTARPPT